MLLQIQKPGLGYAASALDWLTRFERYPKQGARPLLILWPFGPVALVYDVMDTTGKELPVDVAYFPANGAMDVARIQALSSGLGVKNIAAEFIDAGDRHAGSIQLIVRGDGKTTKNVYRTAINKNHAPATQFATLTHELAHLFLGHLGPDKDLSIPERRRPDLQMEELEAESVAFIVCQRNGIAPRSQTYLAQFVEYDMSVDDLDL
ncbi:MAG: ImmA/IrrE family metallo-endopeptidase [Geminicoccaceae bacterium]